MTSERLTRRSWLKAAGRGPAAIATGGLATPAFAADTGAAAAATTATAGRKRLLRVAHLTDIHVQPERAADQGLIACLHHVQSHKDKPDVIFTGGDTIMDAMAKPFDRTKLQWDLWHGLLKQECSLPVFSAVGNHDIWGWNKKRSQTTGQEPQWGKKWATEALRLDRPYHSFDRAGWHFVFLDSVAPAPVDPDAASDDAAAAAAAADTPRARRRAAAGKPPKGPKQYIARLDDEQFAWLAGDLAAVDPKTPTMVVSHIPIFSVAVMMGGNVDQEGDVRLPMGGMHTDYRRIRQLFREHPNVKLAVSGHLHLQERIDFGGVSYLCNGAVSGGWWKGKNMNECDNGYALVDLYDDGSFDSQYVHYGWVAKPEA